MKLKDQIKLADDMIAENPETTIGEYIALLREINMIAGVADEAFVSSGPPAPAPPAIIEVTPGRPAEFLYDKRTPCVAVRIDGHIVSGG